MIALLDINVLVALAWPNHIFHSSARKWFREQKPRGWATCPTTENYTHRQITDAHLLSLALRHQGCLATFDRGIFQLLPGDADAGKAVLLLSSGFA